MTRTIRLGGAVLATAAVVAGHGAAVAQRRLSVDVSSGVSASTNPYLQPGRDVAAESVFVEVVPLYVIEGPTSASRFRGQFRVEPFLRRYSTDAFTALNFSHTTKASDRLQYRAGLDILSSRASVQDALFLATGAGNVGAGVGGGLSPTPLPPIATDPTFVGRNQRVSSASISGGASYITGPRGSIDVDLRTTAFRFGDRTLGDYNYATQRVQYATRRSDRTVLTFGVTLGESNYLGRSIGDGYTISPIVGIETQLTSTLKASVGGGVSLARFRRDLAGFQTITAFAVQARICDTRGPRLACLDVDRSVQPTALGTLRTLTGVVASYSDRLNENDRLTVSASYNASDEAVRSVVVFPDSTFVAARAELSHRISRRLDVFGSAAYGDVFQNGLARRANFQGRLGVRFRAGSIE